MKALFDKLPVQSGAYRWFYADLVSGDFTAVCIFMVGSLFSSDYASQIRYGAVPSEHCSVNFALYEKGKRRCWVFTEYPDYNSNRHDRLRIGGSSIRRLVNGNVVIQISERTPFRGHRVDALLTLKPLAPALGELSLSEGKLHRWEALMPRAKGVLQTSVLKQTLEGIGYLDTNYGEEPLSSSLPRWQWSRSHSEVTDLTEIEFKLPTLQQSLHVSAHRGSTSVWRSVLRERAQIKTGWGLQVPALPQSRLLESSPFYARLEARQGESHQMYEVADFQKFDSPWIRWMARFKTRKDRAA